MKKTTLAISLALLAAPSSGQEVSRPGSAPAYKESQCYKDYVETYKKTVRSATNSMKAKRNLAFSTGIVLNSAPPSDYGKSEKSIVNAADLTPTYKEFEINSKFFLNDFSYIHHEVIQDYPQTDPNTTREYIRRGFETGNFCAKLLYLIPYHKDRKDVANYVKEQIKEDLEKGAIASDAVNDSELDKTEISGIGGDSGKEEQGASASAQSN